MTKVKGKPRAARIRGKAMWSMTKVRGKPQAVQVHGLNRLKDRTGSQSEKAHKPNEGKVAFDT
jgi:hypothetical protein